MSATATPLLETPLHAWHAAHGGRLVDFAGWSMPVQYSSIITEHNATRNAVGLFDVSHMGRLYFSGDKALAFLDTLVTRRVSDLAPGQIRYGLLTNDQGCCLDDILVYHVPAPPEGVKTNTPFAFAMMVVNASNRDKAVAWIQPRLAEFNSKQGSNIELMDITTSVAMIAVQGPRAMELLAKIVSPDPAPLKYYHCGQAIINGVPGIVSRTGYTGEDGCELMVQSDAATALWEKLISVGADVGTTACGLAARDTLRLEAAMPLYGHELDEETTPVEAALDFALTLKERTFPGRDVLAGQKQNGVKKIRVGLTIDGKRPPREGYSIYMAGAKADAAPIGKVTSGTYAPTLQRSIAMGYVPPSQSGPGTTVEIDLRGTRVVATVVKLPFYKRA
jgi:aminomethyltransferase